MKTSHSALCVAALAFASASQAAILVPSTFTFASGDRAASADFSQSGTNLVITLTNTYAGDTLDTAHLLTAVFFDINAPLSTTGGSALVNAGSTLLYPSTCDIGPCTAATTNVGGEWAYLAGLAGAPGGATKGISSTGLGLFGGGNLNGADLDSPAALNGSNFGISSAGDNAATGETGLTNDPVIKNSVVFTLSGLTVGQNYSISNVFFLYGTSLIECNDGPCGGGGGGGNPVPEPGYLLTLALIGVPVLLRYRKSRQLSA